jgi:hypothetical protein
MRKSGLLFLLASTTILACSAAPNDGSVSDESSITNANRPHFMRTGGAAAPCDSTGGNLTSRGGVVMHNARVHLIYWLPSGSHFAIGGTSATDTTYESKLEQFVSDYQSTGLFKMLAQYSDSTGGVSSVSLAGTYTYTKAYPTGRGTTSSPLFDSDYQTAVSDVLDHANLHWATGTEDVYFVFTAAGIESCQGSDLSECTFAGKDTSGNPRGTYGAYHYWYKHNGANVVYANMPADAWLGYDSQVVYPNGAANDPTVQALSHELTEALTDPLLNSWLDANNCEIGDKCNLDMGTDVNPDGSNIVLSNGHKYQVQREWSNTISGCTLATPPSCTSALQCPPTYGAPSLIVTCPTAVDFYRYDTSTHYLGAIAASQASFTEATWTYPYEELLACPHLEGTQSLASCAVFSRYVAQANWCGKSTGGGGTCNGDQKPTRKCTATWHCCDDGWNCGLCQ